MQGDAKVIERLNEALRNELTAINQFLVHARMLEDWGLSKMSAHEYEESQEEHEHAKLLIDRILLLGGTPIVQHLGELVIGGDVKGVLEGDLAIEVRARATLVEAIAVSEAARDFVSRDLFVKILDDEERHEDHLRTELELIGRIGIQNYTQSQI